MARNKYETKKDLEEKIAFVETMKRENPQAFEFLARGAKDLLQKIEQDKQEELKNNAKENK